MSEKTKRHCQAAKSLQRHCRWNRGRFRSRAFGKSAKAISLGFLSCLSLRRGSARRDIELICDPPRPPLEQRQMPTLATIASDPPRLLMLPFDHGLVAISLGAALFGALTCIGNGPNLLALAVAQNLKVPVPTFFGFVFKYAAPILLPIFVLLSILFLR